MPTLLTFGCRLNTFESEVISGLAPANTLVVNTCAVTAEAERQARQAIRRAHRENPARPIVVTGCAAQLAPDRWNALPGVTRVLGNREKLDAAAWAATEPRAVADIMAPAPAPAAAITGLAGRTRAFLAIQHGCDHRCTFCIIPFARGPSRSVPMGALATQLRTIVEGGYREVVLTGVDSASYGPDLPGRPRLGTLVRRLLAAVPDLPRLRLSSLDPAAIDDDLWHAIAEEPRLMPHLHLSLQAGSTLILKRMKRRHTAEHAAATIARARALRPGIAIGADLIAGFPTETDTLFQETLDFVRDTAIPYLHVFPYSERPGTPAARMPAVPMVERRTRAAALRQQAADNARAFHESQVGHMAMVLHETDDAGHTEHFAPVRLPGRPGTLTRARITSADAPGLCAEAA